MKHKDFKPCCICNKGVMNQGIPIFLRITVERFGVDRAAVDRAHGMELMMGGNALLANIMGPDENLAKKIDGEKDLLICHGCSSKPLPPYFWMKEKDDGEENNTLMKANG